MNEHPMGGACRDNAEIQPTSVLHIRVQTKVPLNRA